MPLITRRRAERIAAWSCTARFARLGASDDDIVRAAKAANVRDFVAGLPDGYQTVVGERGMSLSPSFVEGRPLARALIQIKDAGEG